MVDERPVRHSELGWHALEPRRNDSIRNDTGRAACICGKRHERPKIVAQPSALQPSLAHFFLATHRNGP
jgi:hypothetical protein